MQLALPRRGIAVNDAERIRCRDLPHWDVPGAAYFVTSCLEGSIPARGLLDIDAYRKSVQQRLRPPQRTAEEWAADQWKLGFARTDRWLDEEPAVRHLQDERLAHCVMKALYHFAQVRYDLLAFVVMPSHIHWVFQPREEWVRTLENERGDATPRQRIIRSINRFTARECNKILGRSGTFWQHEPYDHWVRSPEELERIIQYVEGNPVKAGLVSLPEEWRFSSARYRRSFGLALGQPLPRIEQ